MPFLGPKGLKRRVCPLYLLPVWDFVACAPCYLSFGHPPPFAYSGWLWLGLLSMSFFTLSTLLSIVYRSSRYPAPSELRTSFFPGSSLSPSSPLTEGRPSGRLPDDQPPPPTCRGYQPVGRSALHAGGWSPIALLHGCAPAPWPLLLHKMTAAMHMGRRARLGTTSGPYIWWLPLRFFVFACLHPKVLGWCLGWGSSPRPQHRTYSHFTVGCLYDIGGW